MTSTLYDNITFSWDDEDNIDNAAELLENSTVVRALKICDKLLGDDKSMIELYGKVFEEATIEARRSKFRIVLEHLGDAYVRCIPNKDVKSDKPHYISFNTKYLPRLKLLEQQNRCTFLHAVKILNEISHTLDPCRRSKGTPCCAWEALVIGGRVLTGGTNAKPFSKPLLLKVIDDSTKSPGYNKSIYLPIDDAEVERLLAALERWTAGEPFPKLTIASSRNKEEEEEEEGELSLPASKRHRKDDSSILLSPLDIGADDQGHESSGVLSEEEYAKLVQQGQAMSAEQEKEWLTGKVKF